MANSPGSAQADRPATTADLVANTPDDRAEKAQAAAVAADPDAAAKAKPDTSGKRVRAIPTHGGTTVSVSKAEFERVGVEDQDEVVWDFRTDDSTVKVGNELGEISEKAAEKITKLEPTRFEYLAQ